MVIETFVQGARPAYERAAAKGRLLPSGLAYLDSWIDEGLDRCFQLMETDDPSLFEAWTAEWSDLVEFEIVPVVGSGDASARVLGP
jgi:hypothetical protein